MTEEWVVQLVLGSNECLYQKDPLPITEFGTQCAARKPSQPCLYESCPYRLPVIEEEEDLEQN